MRIYYDNRGATRVYSTSGREAWFWHGSLTGLFIQLSITAILLPIYYFPRAVWNTKLEPAVKAMIIATGWAAMIAITAFEQAHQDSLAASRGCISITGAPKDYIDPTYGNNNCPIGYEPGPEWKRPSAAPGPPTPSRAVQVAACSGHKGPETGPDFPPPVRDGSTYIVTCMDGMEQGVP